MVFNTEAQVTGDKIKSLLTSGLINVNHIPKIAEVISTPTFARICTYLAVTNAMQSKVDELHPRDAYTLGTRDVVVLMDKLVETNKRMR